MRLRQENINDNKLRLKAILQECREEASEMTKTGINVEETGEGGNLNIAILVVFKHFQE